MPPRDWGRATEDFTRVQKLVHLAARMQREDASGIQVEIFKQKRVAYVDELSVQAANVGCAGRKGVTSPILLAKMMEEARGEALGIVNTYNYDMALAIKHIRIETPTANRHVYAKRLVEWEATRNEWKSKQIMLHDTVAWQDRAVRDFLDNNPQLQQDKGYAIVEPQNRAVCDICQYWVRQGKVKIERIKERKFPVHLNCPHRWVIHHSKRKVDCATLWVGQTIEMLWEQIGGKEVGLKGGPGSGNWGHAGRPGMVGGSGGVGGTSILDSMGVNELRDMAHTIGLEREVVGMGEGELRELLREIAAGEDIVAAVPHEIAWGTGVTVVGDVLDAQRDAVNAAYDTYPQRVRDIVAEIRIHDIDGHEFTAGGREFRATALWSVGDARIDVYKNLRTQLVRGTLSHEVGHAIFDNWQGSSDARLASLAKQWSQARSAGEDGVTPYSKAWDNGTETFAELHKHYRLSLRYGVSSADAAREIRSFAKSEGAPTLGKVFADVVKLYED